MKQIDLIYFNAGGGHRSTANALQQVLQQQSSLQPRLVDIYASGLLQHTDVFFKQGIQIYNFMLRQGLTLLDPLYLLLSRFNVYRNHAAGVRFLERYWRERQPDLVVSTVPFLNRMLQESLQKAKPGTPFVTLLIDFADCPPYYRYWMQPQKQFLICPTERAAQQARSLGYTENQIFRTSGVVISPKFYEPIEIDRCLERKRLGLNPDLPTGLVMFGGYGSPAMLEILNRLERSSIDLQLIFLCGRNEKLADALRCYPGRISKWVEAFTSDVPDYMHLADFLIGKPGPGSISEALRLNLPVITECNAATLVQERYNAEWITAHQVGTVVRHFRDIAGAVANLIQPANLIRYRSNAESINNTAVFEVADILSGLLERDRSTLEMRQR